MAAVGVVTVEMSAVEVNGRSWDGHGEDGRGGDGRESDHDKAGENDSAVPAITAVECGSPHELIWSPDGHCIAAGLTTVSGALISEKV